MVTGAWDGRPTRVLTRLVTPATMPAAALLAEPRPRGRARPAPRCPPAPKVVPAPAAAAPAPQRLSYSALGQYARCPYRFYLQRTLRLPDVRPPEWPRARDRRPAARRAEAPALDPRVRGTIAHVLLEEVDFARPAAPDPARVIEVGVEAGAELTPEDIEDIRGLVEAFGASPLCARLAAARDVRREAGFAFRLDPAGGALVNGFVDVLAREADETTLIVDYKSDRLDGAEPEDVVESELRDAADRLRARGAARGRARRRGRLLLPRATRGRGRRAASPQRDIPELAERLTRLAEGVLERRHPVAAEPHRGLCGDCPGRATLCSWPEEMTLRELAGP